MSHHRVRVRFFDRGGEFIANDEILLTEDEIRSRGEPLVRVVIEREQAFKRVWQVSFMEMALVQEKVNALGITALVEIGPSALGPAASGPDWLITSECFRDVVMTIRDDPDRHVEEVGVDPVGHTKCFKSLVSPVHAGRYLNKLGYDWGYALRRFVDGDVTYFMNADDREIGYFSNSSANLIVHRQPRQWDPAIREAYVRVDAGAKMGDRDDTPTP